MNRIINFILQSRWYNLEDIWNFDNLQILLDEGDKSARDEVLLCKHFNHTMLKNKKARKHCVLRAFKFFEEIILGCRAVRFTLIHLDTDLASSLYEHETR